MDIPYSSRSTFLDACESAIRTQREALADGGTVSVVLGEGGYDGTVRVTISNEDRASFQTDWAKPDPTRFPARIKAAATALLNCGCTGIYEIAHSDGALTIRRA